LQAWRSNARSIALFGLLLVFALIGWERISAILFGLFYGGSVPDLKNFLWDVLFSGRCSELLIAYFGIGAIVAAVAFAASMVSLTMLLDRDVDTATAVITSVSAVRKNLGPMFLWATLLATLTAIGICDLDDRARGDPAVAGACLMACLPADCRVTAGRVAARAARLHLHVSTILTFRSPRSSRRTWNGEPDQGNAGMDGSTPPSLSSGWRFRRSD
jgi:hypothetical protein